MDLVKKNIHMDRTKVSTLTQLSLEEDMNLPENKPDMNSICFCRGWVETEDIKPFADEVRVSGLLKFCLLYHTEESGASLIKLEGKIPFEEKVHLQGVTPSDLVQLDGEVEDLNMGMINSRKLSVKAVVTLKVRVEELYDEEITMGIHTKEPVEYRRSTMDISQIVICKKDIYRMKEEFSVPANYPNIFQILWNDVTLKDLDFRMMNGRVGIRGEVKVFILYEAEGDAHDVLFFEKTMPLDGYIECQGCREDLIPDMQYRISQKDFVIRPDEDGEERNIALEMVLEMKMNLYEEEPVEIITDIYGVGCKVNSECRDAALQNVLSRNAGRMKLTDKIRVKGKTGGILQVVHSEGDVSVEETRNTPEGLNISGILNIRVLFVTGEDAMPYASTAEQIPYSYTLEIPGMEEGDTFHVQAALEQLQLQLLDGEEMELKGVLSFGATVFRPIPVELVETIATEKMDPQDWSGIPGMVIYIVKPGDSLWSIGKQYYIPVDQIKRLNGLESDMIMPGQKLFLIKGGIS